MEEAIDTSYEPFSREPEYIELNHAFVETLDLHAGMRILDVACGTCTMTDLMLARLFAPAGWESRTADSEAGLRSMRVVGIDLSRESLLLGREHMQGLGVPTAQAGGEVVVHLIEGSGTRLPLRPESVDFAIMGNAIQLVPDRGALFGELQRVLRPGGRFAFNTAFYAGTYVPGTERFYLRWVQEARAWLARRSAELEAAGQPGVRRQRGTTRRAFSQPWLSIDDYTREMAEHGLRTEKSNERTVMLDRRCFETIGSYSGLAKVLLSGYPVRLASEALERAAGPALEACGLERVPRYWLEMVACRA